MARIDHYRPLFALSLTLSLGIALTPHLSAPVQAQSQAPRPLRRSAIQWKPGEYRPPSGIGVPSRREGGGTRGCNVTLGDPDNPNSQPKELIALLPENGFGRTVDAHPTFLAYIPASNAPQLEFQLLDEAQNLIYETILPLSGRAGIVSVTIPDSVAISPLAVDEYYSFSFSLVCATEDDLFDRSGDIVVGGVMQRVAASEALNRELAQAPPSRHPEIYARESLWFDALASLAQLRQETPNNPSLLTDWMALLEAVGLGEIAREG
jgi:hypothetical protein